MDNYYQLLGIPRAATPVEVKAAFQKKMKALEASPEQGERRQTQEKLLQQAFLTLLDPARRAKYDKQIDITVQPVLLEEEKPKGVSMVTVVFVVALLAAIVAGGWHVAHKSAERREAERKHDEAVSKAQRERVETAGPRGNPNPFRDGPPSATKDPIMKNSIDRASKDAEKKK